MTVKKSIKVAVGIVALLAISGASYDLSAVESRNAVLNAEAFDILAPIDGRVRIVASPGTVVAKGDVVLVVENPNVDRTGLADLERERVALVAQKARIEAEAAAGAERLEASTGRNDAYEKSRRLMADKDLDRAEAALRAAKASLEVRRQKFIAQDKLKKNGFTSEIAWAEARAAMDEAREEVAARENEVELAKISREAALDGILVGTDRDVSESKSVSQDVAERMAGLDARKAELEASLAALDVRIAAEKEHLEAISTTDILAPSDGSLLDMNIGAGGYVARGMKIGRYLDCSRTVVTALMSGSAFNGLTRGSAARVDVVGTGRSYEAEIEGLGGFALVGESGYVVPMHAEEKRSDFAAVLSIKAVRGSPDACAVGRMVNVRFGG